MLQHINFKHIYAEIKPYSIKTESPETDDDSGIYLKAYEAYTDNNKRSGEEDHESRTRNYNPGHSSLGYNVRNH